MTKSLLTAADIKIFILEAIREINNQDILLNRRQLSRALGISNVTIDNYRVLGLPYLRKGRNIFYSLNQALKWLDQNNKKYNTEKVYEFKQKA